MAKITLDNTKLKKNTAKTYMNGTTWAVNSGVLQILGMVDDQRKGAHYLCEFVGYEGNYVIASGSSIKGGKVKNPFQPTVFGVGYIGQGKHKSAINGKITRFYNLWSNMLDRCYNVKLHKKYPTYTDCSVEKRWHSFQNFCNDIQKLEGYDNWVNDVNPKNMYELDKDKLVKGNKVYSVNTCCFITQAENVSISSVTGLTYIATRKNDGYVEQFTNQSEFAKKYNLDCCHISKCVNGIRKSHKGWIFAVESEVL